MTTFQILSIAILLSFAWSWLTRARSRRIRLRVHKVEAMFAARVGPVWDQRLFGPTNDIRADGDQ